MWKDQKSKWTWEEVMLESRRRWVTMSPQQASRTLTALRQAGFIKAFEEKAFTERGTATAYYPVREWDLDKFRAPINHKYCRMCGNPLWR